MMADSTTSGPPSTQTQPRGRGRGRGRGKSRGGLGKYLRARGRGRSYGRPAEFTKRLVLEGEEEEEEADPEEAEAARQRYSKRQLVSNADRYAEEDGDEEEEGPRLDSDGEEIQEPEVDLSAFLERQRLSDSVPVISRAREGKYYNERDRDDDDDDEIDHSLAHISSRREQPPALRSKKGRVQTIEWDDALERMSRDKAVADANRDLKERFRAKTSALRTKPMTLQERKRETRVVEAPPLPTEESVVKKDPKSQMQDFLDDLLE